MAGILTYTAAPASEGTLGGLVNGWGETAEPGASSRTGLRGVGNLLNRSVVHGDNARARVHIAGRRRLPQLLISARDFLRTGQSICG
jgi:hypothetical protein